VGILGNERCDHIATAFADERRVGLHEGPLKGYDLPNILDVSVDEEKAAAKKSDSARSRAKAYSYVSAVGGVVKVHRTWPECEKRVKGVKGARYKKALDAADEAAIVAEYSAV
jgi:ribonuclease HI